MVGKTHFSTEVIETRKEKLLEAKTDNFMELLDISGLDRAVDLRFFDWSGTDFSHCDLSGCDFTGANLTNCNFEGASLLSTNYEELVERISNMDNESGSAGLSPIDRGDETPEFIASKNQRSADFANFERAIVDRSALRKARNWDKFCEFRQLTPNLSVSAEHLPAKVIFSDAPFAPEMIALPTGSFWMGAPQSELDARPRERPRHLVNIAERFAIGRFTVTFEEFDLYCSATGHAKPDDEGWGRGRLPAVNVSWEECQNYVDWLKSTTGRPYRLPSEAEWEYACRAGSLTPFEPSVAHKNSGLTISSSEANFAAHGQVNSEKASRTVPVDYSMFRPNGWGLWQMHGNVLEWCADNWTPDHTSPKMQRHKVDLSRSDERAHHGGCWNDDAEGIRSAGRHHYFSGQRMGCLGFRVALDL